MGNKSYAVYLLASRRHGTLYVGVTSDLVGRIWEHRAGTFTGFTSEYDVIRLVWYETHTSINVAITREKAIKNWKREWKINLIEAENPDWSDLAIGLGFEPLPMAATRPFRTPSDDSA
jgi:putative endonuclease